MQHFIQAMKSRDDILMASLLGIGLLFPTSIAAQDHQYLIGVAFLLLLLGVLYLLWHYGNRPGAVTFISLPMLIVLSAGTLLSYNFRFGWGVLVEYCMLAAVLALNLRNLRAGRITRSAFLLVNAIWIGISVGIIIGDEHISGFLINWYSQFYEELVLTMTDLHKPVFTFGTHSFAGLFTYLFFWLNWESYKIRRETSSLVLAACHFALLIALVSYTSLAFAAIAGIQLMFWLWKRNRSALYALVASIALTLFVARGMLAEQLDTLTKNPQVATFILNPETSGLFIRYGTGGVLHVNLEYIWEHPFAPIGFTFPSDSLFLSDSGPVEYLLRGSVPLLILIYFGVYRFLIFNCTRRAHALTIFCALLACEVGIGVLPYFRMQFLLPFICVYLNTLGPTDGESCERTLNLRALATDERS